MIIEFAKDFDFDISTTEDGKIKVCFTVDPKDLVGSK
jgi:hypothetical protein